MFGVLIAFLIGITILFLFNLKKVGEIYLPLMILIDMPVAFIVYNEIPGIGLLFNILRLIIVGYTVVKLRVFSKPKKSLLIYLVLAVYLIFVSVVFSSNYIKSFETSLQFLIGLIAYFIGLKVGYCNKQRFSRINRYLFLAIGLLLINVLVSQMLGIGRQAYSQSSIFLGFSNIQTSYLFAYFVAIFGISGTYLKTYKKSFILFFYGLTIIACILYFRRGAILAIFLSLFIILFYKSFNFKKISLLFGLLTLVFLLFQNNFGQIQESMDKRTSVEIGEESRTGEVLVFIRDIEKYKPDLFFGKELFNSQVYLQENYFFPFSFHLDYLAILHGSGIIGFILIFYFLLYSNRILKKNISRIHSKVNRNIFIRTQIALLLSFLIISISGQFYSISSLSFFFIYIGILTSHSNYITNEDIVHWRKD